MSPSDVQSQKERVLDQKKRRQMEDLKAAYLLSCLSVHSFWLNFKNEPEKDFKYFLEAHVGSDLENFTMDIDSCMTKY
ncbi:11057_t:CDS:2 [Racocetra fulgida]|uniref:11057_t:CDS:1 n=1 Tax=Racocetra fulgida TaxID=60492 RepID=A0A9N8WCA5_9GLOM|nr:11057_t:CDS:2 [Racocetra fulgida]